MEGSAIFLKYVFPIVGSILGYIMCLSPLKAVQVSTLRYILCMRSTACVEDLVDHKSDIHDLCSVYDCLSTQLADKTGKLGTLNPIPACVFLCNCVVWLM